MVFTSLERSFSTPRTVTGVGIAADHAADTVRNGKHKLFQLHEEPLVVQLDFLDGNILAGRDPRS